MNQRPQNPDFLLEREEKDLIEQITNSEKGEAAKTGASLATSCNFGDSSIGCTELQLSRQVQWWQQAEVIAASVALTKAVKSGALAAIS